MATTVASMAAKSSDLGDQTSGPNLQTRGHTPLPSRGQKDPEGMGDCPQAVPTPTCHLGLQPGAHCLVALIPGTV